MKTSKKKNTMKTPPKIESPLNLETLCLAKGSHSSPDKGLCIMEAVAFLAKESHSDHPECACPVVSAMLRRLNDQMNDTERQQLKRFIVPLIGSKSTPKVERIRAYLALDWSIRVAVPIALRAAKLAAHATALSKIAPITDLDTLAIARPVLDKALEAARFARRKSGWPYSYWAVATAAAATATATAVAATAVAEVAVAEGAAVAEVAATVVAVAEAAAEAEGAAVARKIRADQQVSALDLVDRMLAAKE